MTRIWTLLLAAGSLAGALSLAGQGQEGHVLVLMGDTFGYLSPCGCTKPMTGGIRRRASAVRALTQGQPATVLESGGFVENTGRQDRLKAEALAEAMRHMGVAAVALTPEETRLGTGAVLSLRNLAGEIYIQSNLLEGDSAVGPRFSPHGPFLVGAATSRHAQIARALGLKSESTEQTAQALTDAAAEAGLMPVLMLADGREEAERLAKAVPGLKLIQYRSTGKPLSAPVRVGETWLVSPGEHGKFVLRLLVKEGRFVAYAPIELGPEYADDPTVSRLYQRYLGRVEREGLLDLLPRSPAPKYAGTAACFACHSDAANAWKESAHAHALRTLIKDGHGRDPDCVGCHVVGLGKTTGFKTVKATPQLANVGCESCHGPGAAHVAGRGKVKLGKAGAKSCAPCHTLDNSPGFEFEPYWKKIAH